MPAPADSETLLAATYGENWRVPDPAFQYSTPAWLSRRLGGWFGGLMARIGVVRACLMLLTGCISEEREREIGTTMASEVNPHLPIIDDPQLNSYLQTLGQIANDRQATIFLFMNLGTPAETVTHGDLQTIRSQSFGPLNVMVLVRRHGAADRPSGRIGKDHAAAAVRLQTMLVGIDHHAVGLADAPEHGEGRVRISKQVVIPPVGHVHMHPKIILGLERQHGIQRFVFSSTCATYGVPQKVPITEEEFFRGFNGQQLVAAAGPRDPRFLMDSQWQPPRRSNRIARRSPVLASELRWVVLPSVMFASRYPLSISAGVSDSPRSFIVSKIV
mgnify:CR=1 FL=1